jgi:beta-N-acetylhexosaminidase
MAERVTALGETTSLADRKRHAGQRLVIGWPKPYVDDDFRRLVREIKPAGFVLFKHNIEDPAQVLELNRELASLVDPATPAIRCVDQEGGRVQRVRTPATVWPPMRVVGRNGVETTRKVARALALELRAMGFDLNFAPDADVDSNPKNPVIGDRSFGDNAAEVAKHVEAFVYEHQRARVIACAKHFPGHGDTSVDSHLALPIVEREAADLREVELPPFKAAVDAGVGSVMSAHVLYPAWDEDLPGTLSARVLHKLLRDELGYDGVVFSDDLEMKAIHGKWTVDQQVDLMTRAGVDVLLPCHQSAMQLDYFEAMVKAQELDLGFHKACKTASDRVQAMRTRFFGEPRASLGLDIVGCAEHQELARLVAARG